MKILKNIGAIFTGADLHYKNVPKTIVERSIPKRVTLRREIIFKIDREEKIINKLFKKYFIIYQRRSHTYKKLREALKKLHESERNEDRVYLIKSVLGKINNVIENVHEHKTFKVAENEKIINVVERILYFNQLDQSGKGLKILTSNQMFSRLRISLAQLNAGNNSEKRKNEIRQLLYSLYRSKKLTKQL